jgi:hypothetical protein
MVSETSLPTHTIFKPSDLSAVTKKSKLPIIVWGMVLARIHPGNI